MQNNLRLGSITNFVSPVSCEHPKLIFNHFLGRFIQVPCRQCNTCKLNHSNSWVQRLEAERKHFPYVFFVTCTYNEAHLPLGRAVEHTNYFEFCSDLTDVHFTISKSDLSSTEITHWQKNKTFGYCDVVDIQLFHKRLRKLISKINETEKLLYYAVAEYGPTTLRPHFHILYFFKSREVARYFSKVVCQAWRNGTCDTQFVSGAATSYVARYVNCYSHLPKALMFKGFAPFQLVSKSRIFGLCQVDDIQIKEIIGQSITRIDIPDAKKPTFSSIRLWRFFENKYFPRCKAFDSLSYEQRVRLYSIGNRYSGATELIERIKLGVLNEDIALLKHIGYTDNTIKSLFTLSNKFLSNAKHFCLGCDDYLNLIDVYYKKVQYEKLRDFYNQINDYMMVFPKSNPIYFYYWDTTVQSDDVLSSFGLDYVPLLVTDVAYQDMVSRSAEQVKKSTKSKCKNDYLALHPELIDKFFS